MEEALVTLARSGGKLLRPAFFFFFLLNWVMKKKQGETTTIKIAASLEILHMATLVIHDDIIDDSPLRRGAVTIQSQYGKDVAVYTGDLLFTEFFTLIADAMNGSLNLLENQCTRNETVICPVNSIRNESSI